MSTTTLRVILDQVGNEAPSGVGRYALELTRQLTSTAPRGCDVMGIVPSSPEAEYARIEAELPGLSRLFKSALDRRQLRAAWQHGFTRLPGAGMVHAPSLFAPLRRHDRVNSPGEQIVVTVHDAVPWTHPETLSPSSVSWARAMARRAERYADAVVVPTHAVAEQLGAALDLGDRIRVIAGAVSSTLVVPGDADERAERLGLPPRYVLAVGPFEARKGISELLWALADPTALNIPLVLAGPTNSADLGIEAVRSAARLAPEQVLTLGTVHDPDLAVAYDRASAVVVPSLAEGFALPVLEAMSLGTPVIHSDAPALVELAADAGIVVDRDDYAGYPRRIAEAIRRVIEEPLLAEDLAIRGHDRARAFTWRDAAEKTWQLHADL
ncbi:glycosyltransferase family 1 protein [Microcella alkalica]|uniref:Glycosyltransferase involved in cell wall biosynthesis n=1 Tax=Microcella alkalica TaxID=355930 RepID=A0A839EH92_9MICO|nr:glycosyltransferase family 1 protein [Microcella alkalica]MBA8848928.1 glycosyltransferase involved in cell wall biosynthesis [Microcella alkalica]